MFIALLLTKTYIYIYVMCKYMWVSIWVYWVWFNLLNVNDCISHPYQEMMTKKRNQLVVAIYTLRE